MSQSKCGKKGSKKKIKSRKSAINDSVKKLSRCVKPKC